MKKLTVILLTLALMAGMAACSGGDQGGAPATNPPETTPAPSTAPAEIPEDGPVLTEENGVLTCLDTENSPFDDCAVHTVVDKTAGTVTFTKATMEGQDTQEYYRFSPKEHMVEQYYFVSMMGTGFYYYYDTELGEMTRMEDADHNDNTESSKESGRFDGAAERIKGDVAMLEAYFADSFGMTIPEAVQ